MSETTTQPLFATRTPPVAESATLAINQQSAALRAVGKQVARFGLGQSPFPVPSRVVQALRDHAYAKDYLPVRGLLPLREAVADYLQPRIGESRGADSVIIGPGSKELLFLLQWVMGAELLLPAPSWVSYEPQARLLNLPVRWIQTSAENHWRLSADDLAAACAANPGTPKLLILNYPNNPAGSSYGDAELQALAAVARANHVLVIADEIYAELRFDGVQTSLARYYPEGTVISTGLSKWCGAGGWRLGAMSFPAAQGHIVDTMAGIGSETFSAVSAPIQWAAVTAYGGGPDLDAYLRDSRRVMAAVTGHAAERLRQAGLDVVDTEGGFYLLADFSPLAEQLAAQGVNDSAELCRRLLADAGVACLPGADFGLPAGQLLTRLALVDFDGDLALRAADLLTDDQRDQSQWLQRFAADTWLGIERMADWAAALASREQKAG